MVKIALPAWLTMGSMLSEKMNMELRRDAKYYLTSDILCIGAETRSDGLYYLRAGSKIQVVEPESRPFVEVLHSNGRGRLFAQDLMTRAVLIEEPTVRSAAA